MATAIHKRIISMTSFILKVLHFFLLGVTITDYETFEKTIMNIESLFNEYYSISREIEKLPLDDIKKIANDELAKIKNMYETLPEIPVNFQIEKDKIAKRHSAISSCSIAPRFLVYPDDNLYLYVTKIKMDNGGMRLIYQDFTDSGGSYIRYSPCTDSILLQDIKDRGIRKTVLKIAYPHLSKLIEDYVNAINKLKEYLLSYI